MALTEVAPPLVRWAVKWDLVPRIQESDGNISRLLRRDASFRVGFGAQLTLDKYLFAVLKRDGFRAACGLELEFSWPK